MLRIKDISLSKLLFICLLSLSLSAQGKSVTDFNADWYFTLDKQIAAHQQDFNHSSWQSVTLPHDWAVVLPYTNENAAASTGFKAGGLGWYRKAFTLNANDSGKRIWVEFDGIYNHSDIWINGHHVANRPYGYTSFQADLTDYLAFDGTENVLAVKVNRTSYADSRWYTGSGIYRNVRLVKADAVYIPQWGIQITTPLASKEQANINIATRVLADKYQGEDAEVHVAIVDSEQKVVASHIQRTTLSHEASIETMLTVQHPQLWHINNPSLYQAHVTIRHNQKVIDKEVQTFGIRDIHFDANKGFLLNGQSVKIKGVNLHHDAGAVGTAVDKSVWYSRMLKLKSVGVNALRLSHNPHSPELLELADELGFLVNAEAFDDWDRAKKKSLVRLGDNGVTGRAGHSYSEYFDRWAERDIKAMVQRDFNHPSVIMWSLGNEVEWSYPYYPKATSYEEDGGEYYEDAPNYNVDKIRARIKKHNPDSIDNLPRIAHELSKFIKQIDTSRPVTSGLTHPSVGFATGYIGALDIIGFNYRAHEYEVAHATYPDAIIYGSENWGGWSEWRDVKDKDYVAGIFIWTGFAYKGESGPLPKMGLEISLFDFIGNKTPRGHFFETLWVNKPKIWLGTTAAEGGEYQYSKEKGWSFTSRSYPEGVWAPIRKWEWYDIDRTWKYAQKQNIVVQSYTNAEEAELFLNGTSLGKQTLTDFDDRVIKWLVPYASGKLEVVGYSNGIEVARDSIATHGAPAQVLLNTERATINADGYDSVYVHASVLDKQGNLIPDSDAVVTFDVSGPHGETYVDNGFEFNIGDVLADSVVNHKGKAAVLIQAAKTVGTLKVKASVNGIKSNLIQIQVK